MSDSGGQTLRFVCFSCRRQRENFVKIELSEEEREARYLSYLCSSCALRQQRIGEIVDAREVLHFYTLNTRELLGSVLQFYEETDRGGEYGDIYERRRDQEVAEMERLRAELEGVYAFLEAIYEKFDLPQPDPGWRAAYERRAGGFGLAARIVPPVRPPQIEP